MWELTLKVSAEESSFRFRFFETVFQVLYLKETDKNVESGATEECRILDELKENEKFALSSVHT